MQASLVIGGHSHIAAFVPFPPATPAPAADVFVPVALAVDGATVIDGPTPRDETYWDLFVDTARERVPAVVWTGDQHLRALLIEPVPPLDFVLSAAPDLPLDPRASYVAEAQFRALFAPTLAPLAPLIARLRAVAADGLVLVTGTPPPIGDSDAIARCLPVDPAAGTPAPLGSPYTLQKAWSLLQIMLAEAAADAGATFVPVPDRTRDPEGFLLPGCWADDAVHAGPLYAREVLADLATAAQFPTRTTDR